MKTDAQLLAKFDRLCTDRNKEWSVSLERMHHGGIGLVVRWWSKGDEKVELTDCLVRDISKIGMVLPMLLEHAIDEIEHPYVPEPAA